MPISLQPIHTSMNPKIIMPFSTMAIAAVALLFASGPIVASQQALAFVVVPAATASTISTTSSTHTSTDTSSTHTSTDTSSTHTSTDTSSTHTSTDTSAPISNRKDHSTYFLFFMNLRVNIKREDQFTEIASGYCIYDKICSLNQHIRILSL